MNEGRFANVTAALLLGGLSSRMGTDKSHLPIAGVAAATRLARGLATLFEEVLLVGGTPPADAPGRRVEDPPGPSCALRGLVAALAAASAEKVLVVATDLPGLSPELVLALLAAPEADAVVPRAGGKLQPLCALYRRDVVLPRARARQQAGPLALGALLEELDVGELGGPDLEAVDPDGRALCNLNTPEDLEAFRARAQASPGPVW